MKEFTSRVDLTNFFGKCEFLVPVQYVMVICWQKRDKKGRFVKHDNLTEKCNLFDEMKVVF